MPEGHVIHRLASQLTEAFGGREVEVSSPQGRFAAEAAQLDGTVLRSAEAWGKHLFIDFSPAASTADGAPADAAAPVGSGTRLPRSVVHIHLGLIGKFNLSPFAEPVGQVRLRIGDADETVAADLHGPQWCRLLSVPEKEAEIAKQGADPLRADADPSATFAKVARSRRAIGALLMDQKLFAGVGNIYRAETLFRLGVSPFTPGRDVPAPVLKAIWADLVELVAVGVDRGRIDTVRPEHTPEAMHRAPRKDDHGGEVYVYRRAGQPCLVCGTPVEQRVMDGRNLFWCPSCQPDRR